LPAFFLITQLLYREILFLAWPLSKIGFAETSLFSFTKIVYMLTFVSAYYNIYAGSPPLQRTDTWRFQHFRTIAETGILICLYVSPDYRETMAEWIQEYPNVRLMDSIALEETSVGQCCAEVGEYTLPANRNVDKDTAAYLQLQNSKTAFVYNAIQENPWKTEHFAWLDFNVAHIFNNATACKKQLQMLSHLSTETRFLTIPGCWPKWQSHEQSHFLDNIHWRFCGGFFMGDKATMLEFCRLTQHYFRQFLEMTHKLVWEVNVWAWMETQTDLAKLNLQWFGGNHDDHLLQVPVELVCSRVKPQSEVQYSYPYLERYYPTSASYVCVAGKHWLNTRFVSYYLMDNGCYFYPDGSHVIKNKNLLSPLERDAEGRWRPTGFEWMKEESIDLVESTPESFSRGLEDLRLFAVNGRTMFIATSINYSPAGHIWMVVGDYNVENQTYSNCQYVVPPNPDQYCEKNWTPVVRKNVETGSDEAWFIYSWNPMQIGRIKEEGDGCRRRLEIVDQIDTSSLALFRYFRGSTAFVATTEDGDGDGYIGLVHFSVETTPRHYYHCVVVLDTNLHPVKYSMPFYFQKVSVEFCIGMDVSQETYTFWFSRMDRDPMMICVSKKDVLLFDV